MNWTSIAWTDLSTNPLKYRDNNTGKDVWACVKVSPGCANCYSESLATRYNRGGPFTRKQLQTVTPYIDFDEVKYILRVKQIKRIPLAGVKCFAFDMTDVFGEWVPDEFLDVFFAMFSCRPDITFQVLTKRVERMRDYTRQLYSDIAGVTVPRLRLAADKAGFGLEWRKVHTGPVFETPLPNVWLGTSVENNAVLRERGPVLGEVRAKVRFFSAEPLLEELDPSLFGFWKTGGCPEHLSRFALECVRCNSVNPTRINFAKWVIVGGESGAGSRPMPAGAVSGIIEAGRRCGFKVFVKQMGTVLGKSLGCGGKAEDPEQWPIEFRVREWPG